MQDLNKETSSKKRFLFTGVFLAALAICVCLMSACSSSPESSEKSAETNSPSAAADTITVSVLVDSSAVANEGYPESMASEEITLEKGASAYDAITKTGLSLGGTELYISSIDGLSEGQYGPSSGWLYFVDGEMPDVGGGDYVLEGGESLSWLYVLDMNEYF